jgi:N4-gp56 family major capsid protein
MAREFNDPLGGDASTVGPQIVNDFYKKKALIEIRKEQYFSQLADVTAMPKNMGKKIKLYHYLPLLDDANINDQGIDAAGVTIATTAWYITYPRAVMSIANASKATAAAAINDNVVAPWFVLLVLMTVLVLVLLR